MEKINNYETKLIDIDTEKFFSISQNLINNTIIELEKKYLQEIQDLDFDKIDKRLLNWLINNKKINSFVDFKLLNKILENHNIKIKGKTKANIVFDLLKKLYNSYLKNKTYKDSVINEKNSEKINKDEKRLFFQKNDKIKETKETNRFDDILFDVKEIIKYFDYLEEKMLEIFPGGKKYYYNYSIFNFNQRLNEYKEGNNFDYFDQTIYKKLKNICDDKKIEHNLRKISKLINYLSRYEKVRKLKFEQKQELKIVLKSFLQKNAGYDNNILDLQKNTIDLLEII